MTGVEVFGADWCPLTRRALGHLDRLRIPYRYINVEQDPAASQWVKEQNGGRERKPTIRIGDAILVEPTYEQLDEALTAASLL